MRWEMTNDQSRKNDESGKSNNRRLSRALRIRHSGFFRHSTFGFRDSPRPRASRKPTFFWQAVLIVLPVAVLAALGLVSLRQDKLLAEQEAREQAQAIAWTLALECGARLNSDIEEFAQASRRQEQVIGVTAGTLRPGPGQDAAELIRSGQAVAARWQRVNPGVQLSALPQARCLVRDGVLIDPP